MTEENEDTTEAEEVEEQPSGSTQTGNPQRRHWVTTVHLKHITKLVQYDDLDVAEIVDIMEDYFNNVIVKNEHLRYATGVVEEGEELGRLHMQIYTEWLQPLRRSEMSLRFHGHHETIKGTRTTARRYCRKADTRVVLLPEAGVWRAEVSPHRVGMADQLTELVIQGYTPDDIAVMNPQGFFRFHGAIKALYRALGGADKADERLEIHLSKATYVKYIEDRAEQAQSQMESDEE